MICPYSYADTQSFGSKKFTEKAIIVGAGTVTLKMSATVKSSKAGYKYSISRWTTSSW